MSSSIKVLLHSFVLAFNPPLHPAIDRDCTLHIVLYCRVYTAVSKARIVKTTTVTGLPTNRSWVKRMGGKEKANKESRGKKQNEFLTTWKRKTDSLRRACTLDARVYEATEPQRLIRQPLSFSYQIESGIKYFPSNSIIFCLFRIFFKDGKTHRQGNKVLFFRLIFRRSFFGFSLVSASRFDFGCQSRFPPRIRLLSIQNVLWQQHLIRVAQRRQFNVSSQTARTVYSKQLIVWYRWAAKQ